MRKEYGDFNVSELNGFPESGPIPLQQGDPTYERRSLDMVVLKLKALHTDVNDMKGILKELTQAINRLALVEERQTQTAASLERAFVALKEVEGRVSTLELSNVNTSRTSASFDKIVWMAVTAVGTAILTLVLIGAHK